MMATSNKELVNIVYGPPSYADEMAHVSLQSTLKDIVCSLTRRDLGHGGDIEKIFRQPTVPLPPDSRHYPSVLACLSRPHR